MLLEVSALEDRPKNAETKLGGQKLERQRD